MTSLRSAPTRVWLTGLCTVTTAACGGTATRTPAPTSGPTAAYPCNLVTTSQVERQVGVALSQGVPTLATDAAGQPTDPSCSFGLAGTHHEHVPVGAVQITMVTAAEFARRHVSPVSGGGLSRPIRITGADEAVLVWGPGSGSVCARRGVANYIVLRPGAHEDSFVEQAVAESVAAHLK
jgi:hypothetical protein